MENNICPQVGDKVVLVNCIAAMKHKGKIFTVKQSPVIYDRSYAVVLKEIRGFYLVKNLKIVKIQ